jgi:hypothetical protein
MQKSNSSLVKWLNLAKAIREAAPFNDLTADEEQLLEDLIVRWHRAATLTVSDIMYVDQRSTPSTAYRRLVALKNKGLVTVTADANDKRVRVVAATPKASEYMKRLEQGLDTLKRKARPA